MGFSEIGLSHDLEKWNFGKNSGVFQDLPIRVKTRAPWRNWVDNWKEMWTETRLPGSTAKMNDMMYFSTVRVYINLMRVTRSVSRHLHPKRSRELYSWNHQRRASRKLRKLWHPKRSWQTSQKCHSGDRDGATQSETVKINSPKRVNWQIIFKPTASLKVSSSKNWNRRSHRRPQEPRTAHFCGWSIFSE